MASTTNQANPASNQSADDFIKSIGGPTKWDTGPGSVTPAASDDGPILQDAPSRAVGGAIQGAVLDPIEGVGQAFEHYTGKHISVPQSVRDYFDRVQQEVHGSRLGRIGEIGGAVGSAFIAPEAALGWVGRGAEAVNAARAARTVEAAGARGMNLGELAQASKGAREARLAGKPSNYFPNVATAEKEAGRALTEAEKDVIRGGGKGPGPPPPVPSVGGRVARGALGSAAAAAAQPVDASDEDFTQQKVEQAGLGAITGGLAGGLAKVPISHLVHQLHRHPFRSMGSGAIAMEGLTYALAHLGLGHLTLPAGLAAIAGAVLGKLGPGATRGAAAAEGQLFPSGGSYGQSSETEAGDQQP